MRKTKYDYDNCIGKTVNDLTFVKEVKRTKGTPRKFICKCVCGREKEYKGVDVFREHTKNCGCSRKQKLLNRNKEDNPSKYIKKHYSKYPYDECIGTTVNHLTFIKEIELSKYERRQFLVRCECGKEFPCEGVMVFNGSTRSCGCYRKSILSKANRTHGLRDSPEYNVWASMIQRCTNPNSDDYKNYGERGIMICDRWNDFQNFLGDMGKRPTPSHSIDRIDVNGIYEPKNCKWSTRLEQSRNQRLRGDNSTGVRGVSKSGNNYLVRISIEGKRKTIGSFKTLKDAREARKQAEIKYWS